MAKRKFPEPEYLKLIRISTKKGIKLPGLMADIESIKNDISDVEKEIKELEKTGKKSDRWADIPLSPQDVMEALKEEKEELEGSLKFHTARNEEYEKLLAKNKIIYERKHKEQIMAETEERDVTFETIYGGNNNRAWNRHQYLEGKKNEIRAARQNQVDYAEEFARQLKEQKMTVADQKKLDQVNQLINEKAEVQADGSLRISSEDWRGINRKLNEKNIEKNKMFEDAIRGIADEGKEQKMETFWRVRYQVDTKKKENTSDINPITSFDGKPKPEFLESGSIIQYSEYFNFSDEPVAYKKMQSFQTGEFTNALNSLLEKRNINSKENFMSDVDENEGQARDPKEEAFLNTVHQRKVIADALKAGKLSCLPGADGLADTQPAVNLVNGTFYHGTNLLFLKEHQKENGFPSAEYLTAGQIDKARKDNPDLFIRKGQKGVSIYVSEKNEETGEYENKSFRLFNVAQTTKPAAMKEWAEQQRQEKLQEKLEYLQTQYGTGYKLPEPKEKGPGPEIVCSSTEPKEYLGQYLAAVSLGGKFKASKEQAAEFAQKLEGTLFEKMDNGHTNPFKLEKISIEASKYCREFIPKALTEARKAEQPQQQQEQTQSHSHHM